jgi:mannan endo-1,4-beta-mannosidase
MEAAAGALELYGASLPDNTTGPALVRSLLDRAQLHGLNVLRAWAAPVSPPYALSDGPGQYNENIFRGLDYLLDEARKRGVRVLLALTDNWQQTGGADQMLSWATGQDQSQIIHEDFFSNTKAKQIYKDHVKVVLERKNTVNGRAYKNDPTIFALDLINEPRCFQCRNLLQKWIEEMATWVKSIAPHLLLTVGEEGFYPDTTQGATKDQMISNPQGVNSWAFWEGQHFYKDHSSPLIDFAAIHLWIHNWEDATEPFAKRWLKQHIADAKALGKPLLVEEFGAWGVGSYLEQRTQWYKLVYDILAEDARQGGPTMGALFWQWFAQGQKAPREEGGGDGGLFGLFDSDETWSEVEKFTQIMRELNNNNSYTNSSRSSAFTCSASSSSPVAAEKAGDFDNSSKSRTADTSPVPDCSHTRVKGRDGTGYEGISCDIDINECARGTADCSPNAACVNTAGGYLCSCYLGYPGDGKSCVASSDYTTLINEYTTLGPGKTACQEGQDVVYPFNAPGFADDVIDALERHTNSLWKGGVGSRVHVTPEQCMIACSTAPGCDSFSYNPSQRRCFLKSGAMPEICETADTVCTSARGGDYSCGRWQTYFKASEVKKRGEFKMASASVAAAVAAEQAAKQQQSKKPQNGGNKLVTAFDDTRKVQSLD